MGIALYPGSFDPITLGHLNIIRRAATIFDQLEVCVAANSDKRTLFSLDERMDFLRRSCGRFDNVKIVSTDRLVADYCREHEIKVLVKGLRAVSDFEYEFQIAMVNKKIYPQLDTLFLTSSEKYTFLSSTVVKELARYGADISELVPMEIKEDVIKLSQLRRKV